MDLNLQNKSFAMFGLPDSGKSTLAHCILCSYGSSAFVYDTLNEYPDQPFDRYAPRGRYDAAELERVIKAVKSRYSLIIIDETNRFCPSKPKPLPQEIADLNDFRAHYGLAVGFMARRPVQLNQDLTELAHYLLIFRLPVKNDIDYLNSLSADLGDVVSQLPKYHFAVVDSERNFTICPPVPANFTTDKQL